MSVELSECSAARAERAAPAASLAAATPTEPQKAGSITLAQLDAHEGHVQLAARGSRSTLMLPTA